MDETLFQEIVDVYGHPPLNICDVNLWDYYEGDQIIRFYTSPIDGYDRCTWTTIDHEYVKYLIENMDEVEFLSDIKEYDDYNQCMKLFNYLKSQT